MKNGQQLIEKLLSYAVEKLYLQEVDVDYKRHLLCRLLKIDPSEVTDKTFEGVELSSLISQLKNYVVENSLSDDADDFCGVIFGALMPLPSAIEKSFKLFREQMSAVRAQGYYYGIMKSAGYVDDVKFAPLSDRGDKVCLFVRDMPETTCAKYRADERYITVNLTRDYLFGYEKRGDFYEQGALIRADGEKLSVNAAVLDDMFEFVEYMPEYHISFSRENDDKNGKFFVFKEKPPISDAAVTNVFRSEKYPDVEVSLLDWYLPAIRFSGYNKNTLISLIFDTIGYWGDYSEGENSPEKPDNYVQSVLKLKADGRYTFDMVLRRTDLGLTQIKLGNRLDEILTNKFPFTAALGKFIFAKETNKLISDAVAVLTGKAKFDPISIAMRDDPMYPVGEIVVMLVEENGVFKDAAKAEVAVKNKFYESAANALRNGNAFEGADTGSLKLKIFLHHADINQI